MRIRPPKDLEKKVVEALVDRGFFKTKAACLIFAAAVGIRFGRRASLDRTGEGIRLEYFDGDDVLRDILAISTKEELEIMRPDCLDERTHLFEEFVHGGLQKIDETCFSAGTGAFLDGLLDLVDLATEVEPQTLPGLEEIERLI
jgi:dnd system-associated protein 4